MRTSSFPIASTPIVFLGGLLLAAGMLTAGTALAQQGIRPGDEPLEVPSPGPEQPAPELRLPAPPPLAPGESLRPPLGPLGLVREIRVEGSSVFEPEELAAALAPFEGRLLSAQDLYAARDAISRLYHDAGYVTSGAVLPDQEVEDGIVLLQVIEGRLTEIEVSGNKRFREHYFRSRLRRAGRTPVNVFQIERALQRLQQDPLIERISSNLAPGAELGESRLLLVVAEALPARLDIGASNYRSPSLGEYTGEFFGEAANLIGFGDSVAIDYQVADGLQDVDVSLRLPLNRYDTILTAGYRYSRGEVVLDDFNTANIRSKSETWSVGLEQPVYREYGRDVRIGLVGELRESRTEVGNAFFCTITGEIGGAPISGIPAFQAFGELDCDPQVAVLRFFQQMTLTGQRSAIAVRSTVSAGLDAFGATRNPNTIADGRFFAWLGQLQMVHQLSSRYRDAQVVARVDAQLANDALLSIEKFSLGGVSSVRGYRENQLVRDNGVTTSLELRIPIIETSRPPLDLQLVPFLDFGHGWDEHGPGQQESDTLVSLGAGIRVRLYEAVRGELFYGHHLTEATGEQGDGMQQKGLHFRIVVDTLTPWR